MSVDPLDPAASSPAVPPGDDLCAELLAELDALPVLQAVNRTPHRRGRVTWLVIHVTQNQAGAGMARNVAHGFARQPPSTHGDGSSAHVIVGQDEAVRCVADADEAWAAQGANEAGLHLEHVGMSEWPPEAWRAGAGADTLQRGARILAAWCIRHAIPPSFVDAEGILRGEPGITSHVEITGAGKLARVRGIASPFSRSTHWDPGGMPVHEYVDQVRALLGEGPAAESE